MLVRKRVRALVLFFACGVALLVLATLPHLPRFDLPPKIQIRDIDGVERFAEPDSLSPPSSSVVGLLAPPTSTAARTTASGTTKGEEHRRISKSWTQQSRDDAHQQNVYKDGNLVLDVSKSEEGGRGGGGGEGGWRERGREKTLRKLFLSNTITQVRTVMWDIVQQAPLSVLLLKAHVSSLVTLHIPSANHSCRVSTYYWSSPIPPTGPNFNRPPLSTSGPINTYASHPRPSL